ncbi:MAG: glycosyltransferase family 1 protein [Nitrospirota bacterium]|nr:glycosyltransferase family 1 protein [Nitrospirota bacterium]
MILLNSRFLTHKTTGVQRYAVEISKQLKKLHSDVKFIAPKKILDKDLERELCVITTGKNNGHFWEQIDLPLYLKRVGNPLLINLCNTAPLLYSNQIITILDLSFLRNPKWFLRSFYLYYKFLIPKIAKKASKIITISEFSKKEIMDLLNVPEDKIHVIYCAVSGSVINLTSPEAYNRYAKYILAVSSLDPRKNFKNLIMAYNNLKLSETRLVIVGSENKVFSDSKLRNIINASKDIIFTGYVSDEELAVLYKNAKLFVYPSLYEGFGIPPLEAMACGCPVVVSNAASLPEVCGDAAYYVDPYDIDDIARGISEVLNNEKLQEELGQKGLERVKLFSWKDSAEKLLSVIKEVCDG